MRPAFCVAALSGALLLAAPRRASAQQFETVPVDVGVGPAGYVISGPVFDDQPVHLGLKISLYAIISQELIHKHQNRVPARYRARALRMKEVRYRPSIFIPDALIISPKVQNTGIYGISWQPISVSLPLTDGPVGLRLGAGLLLTYAFIHSDVLPTTHFIRPGLDLGIHVEIPLTPGLLVGFGWSSGLYVPQELGGFGVGALNQRQTYDELNQTLWHFGQAYLQIHVRFPYRARI